MTPRYLVIPAITPAPRYLVRDTEAGQFCPTIAAGMTRAQAELYAERLNARAELGAHLETMEACS